MYADEILLDTWQESYGRNSANAEHFWPICRHLSELGWVVENQEDVAARAIGPFRLATTLDGRDAFRHFIDTAWKAGLDYLQEGEPVSAAVAGILDIVTTLYCDFRKQGVIVEDEIVWSIILYTKERNNENRFPNTEEITSFLNSSGFRVTDTEANDRIEKLRNYPTLSGDEISLIEPKNGGYSSLV